MQFSTYPSAILPAAGRHYRKEIILGKVITGEMVSF